MYIYNEFYTVFVNLIWGSVSEFNTWQANISQSTNNWLLDGFNAVLIRLPDIATVLFLILVFMVICWLPILLYRLFQNLDPKYKRWKK